MNSRFYIRIAELALVLLLAATIILAWREARADRAQLQAQLAAANQALAATTNRQQDRDAKLNDVLTNIAAEKKATTTPAQLLAGIAQAVGLAAPLTLQPQPVSSATGKSNASAIPNPAGNSLNSPPSNPPQPGTLETIPATATTSAQLPTAPDAKIPAADLKPLYDYLLDCKACQVKLAASQSDLADEKTKTATLTKSRDDALRAANGGSVWKRTARALKWFAIGAAAGAIAAKTTR
jgi:hypothetical protein